MRYMFWAIACLLLLDSATALAQNGPVSLRPGEQAVVELNEGDRGRVMVSALSEEEQISRVQWMFQRRDAAGPSTDVEIPAIAPNILRITFLNLKPFTGSDERLLLVENGYDRALRYRAIALRNERSEPTSVCTVIPMLPSVEHWSHPIDRIDLSNLTLVPYLESDSITCE